MKKYARLAKSMTLGLVLAVVGVVLAACGGDGPLLPSYSQSAPANGNALVALLDDAGYDAFEWGTGVVTGTKMEGSYEYLYVGINTALTAGSSMYETTAEIYKSMFDAFKQAKNLGGNALNQALADAGITNFKVNDTAASWSVDGGSVSIALRGDWVLVEIITLLA